MRRDDMRRLGKGATMFYDEGYQAASLVSKIHSLSTVPVPVPAFGDGSHWQATAFRKGFIAGWNDLIRKRKGLPLRK